MSNLAQWNQIYLLDVFLFQTQPGQGVKDKKQEYRKVSSLNSNARRKCQPTPVFLPGKSHGRRNLVGYSLQGSKEQDMTEHTHQTVSCGCSLEEVPSCFYMFTYVDSSTRTNHRLQCPKAKWFIQPIGYYTGLWESRFINFEPLSTVGEYHTPDYQFSFLAVSTVEPKLKYKLKQKYKAKKATKKSELYLQSPRTKPHIFLLQAPTQGLYQCTYFRHDE